ncbi:S8 family serine peptidase [Micromonospora sp. BRA006-A]|nr:S8 family serine peptidase [Micromonospora sp. BRA006-A]
MLAENKENFDPDVPAEIGKAIRWAVDHDADVINLSLVTLDDPALKSAVQYALGKDVVIVASAGNRQENREDRPAYPAAYEVSSPSPGSTSRAGTSAARSAGTRGHRRPRPEHRRARAAGRATGVSRRAGRASPPRTSPGWPRWCGPRTRTSAPTRSPTG